MSCIERYRAWFEQEKASNAKMLGMVASVPEASRSDPRFERAVVLAAHLAACRENWLDRMVAGGTSQVDWWPEGPALEDLPARFAVLEAKWTAYLASLTDQGLDVDFEFPVTGGRYRWNIEGQIMQLVGHAFYHRGQIALLVDELGGTAVDTDYLYWAFETHSERWKRVE
jgi:uncharacterized damage-inducible protein DinB